LKRKSEQESGQLVDAGVLDIPLLSIGVRDLRSVFGRRDTEAPSPLEAPNRSCDSAKLTPPSSETPSILEGTPPLGSRSLMRFFVIGSRTVLLRNVVP
jgi:hypothetical protein